MFIREMSNVLPPNTMSTAFETLKKIFYSTCKSQSILAIPNISFKLPVKKESSEFNIAYWVYGASVHLARNCGTCLEKVQKSRINPIERYTIPYKDE